MIDDKTILSVHDLSFIRGGISRYRWQIIGFQEMAGLLCAELVNRGAIKAILSRASTRTY